MPIYVCLTHEALSNTFALHKVLLRCPTPPLLYRKSCLDAPRHIFFAESPAEIPHTHSLRNIRLQPLQKGITPPHFLDQQHQASDIRHHTSQSPNSKQHEMEFLAGPELLGKVNSLIRVNFMRCLGCVQSDRSSWCVSATTTHSAVLSIHFSHPTVKCNYHRKLSLDPSPQSFLSKNILETPPNTLGHCVLLRDHMKSVKNQVCLGQELTTFTYSSQVIFFQVPYSSAYSIW